MQMFRANFPAAVSYQLPLQCVPGQDQCCDSDHLTLASHCPVSRRYVIYVPIKYQHKQVSTLTFHYRME